MTEPTTPDGTDKIEVGGEYQFYAEMQQEYEPREKRMRNYTGLTVKVISQEFAGDEESSPRWNVRTLDGFEFVAQEEELNGWDRDLGQYFWPDGTYGPDHDRTFLVNEKRES